MRARFVLPVLMGLAASTLAAGCGSTSAAAGSGGTATTSTAGETGATKAPKPAGALPSEISKMVCSAEAEGEISTVLGVTPRYVSTPTWVAHLYSCKYVYRNGYLGLSVKELSSWAQTYAYYDSLARQLGKTASIGNLGQGAFAVKNGSVVVRKDWKVLLVDDTGLPPKLGVPPTTRAEVAFTVADVILGCWSGD